MDLVGEGFRALPGAYAEAGLRDLKRPVTVPAVME